MKKLTFFVSMLSLPLFSMAQQDFTETAFGINMKMIYVEGGTFTMGCIDDQDNECCSCELPSQSVTVSSFYIGMLEVTQGQWEKVMGTSIYQQRDKAFANDYIKYVDGDGCYGVGADYPMYYVNREEIKEFCARLSRQTGRKYSLPTEAEWEYAARGGKENEGTKYAGSRNINDVAWYEVNSNETTHPCGTKHPNVLGIYDMSGNVTELCEDRFRSYDNNNPKCDKPSYGVQRGGAHCWEASRCRVASRELHNGIRHFCGGFRVVIH